MKKTIAHAKTSTSSRTSKKPTTKHLGTLFIEIPPEKYFVLADGSHFKDYHELADALQCMSDELFAHHVNAARNDFANWIHDVFHEQALADGLRVMNSRAEMCALLYRHLFEKSEQLRS